MFVVSDIIMEDFAQLSVFAWIDTLFLLYW